MRIRIFKFRSNKFKSPFVGKRHLFAWAALCVSLMVLAQANAVLAPNGSNPRRPKNQNKIELIHADDVIYDQFEIPGAQRFSGNVEFLHNGMRLFCDSAVLFQASNSFEAFGHVRMLQGDTLSLTGDRLYYHGDDLMAEVRNNVVLKHRKQTLLTDSLNYDRLYNLAYFFEGGKLIDGHTILTSDWGEYHTDTKKTLFNYHVELKSPKFRLVTDTLHYDTSSKWAQAVGPSNIYSGEDRIYTENGFYNTQTERTRLFNRSRVYGRDSELEGDSIFYDKKTGDMFAHRNVVFEDKKNKGMLFGDFCSYNELTGKALAHGKALAKYYSNEKDTLFVHADTLRLFTFNIETDSVYRVLHGYFHARAFRSDVQAVSDSLVFISKDKKLSLYRDPIVWSGNRQILGEEINVFCNDSTIDSVYVERQAFLAEQVDSTHFNQVSAQLMRSYFEKGEMKRNFADGNVYVVNYPLERDSTLLYQNYTETSQLRMYMKNRKLSKLWAPAAKGAYYAIGMAPPDKTFLESFAWFDYIRPRDKYDLFEWRPKKRGTELKASVRHEAPVQVLDKKKGKK